MLHIKLPKKKVAGACERTADRLTQRIKVIPVGHIANDTARACLATERDWFHTMADMSMRSVGDVYVSYDLWSKIKEVY